MINHHTLSPAEFNSISAGLSLNLKNAENILCEFISYKMDELNINPNNMGLTPDVIKQNSVYRLNKASVDVCFLAVRDFNASVSNAVKREAQKLRRSELILK